jgi:hypothetical protein
MAKFSSEGHFRSVLGTKLSLFGIESQAIESGGTANGIPDMYFSSKLYSIQGWIELKNDNGIPKRAKYKVPYRPGQFAWLTRYVKQGTSCILGLAFDEGIAFFCDNEIAKEYEPSVIRDNLVIKDTVEAFIKTVRQGVNSAKIGSYPDGAAMFERGSGQRTD